jgi:hypothetical protein
MKKPTRVVHIKMLTWTRGKKFTNLSRVDSFKPTADGIMQLITTLRRRGIIAKDAIIEA